MFTIKRYENFLFIFISNKFWSIIITQYLINNTYNGFLWKFPSTVFSLHFSSYCTRLLNQRRFINLSDRTSIINAGHRDGHDYTLVTNHRGSIVLGGSHRKTIIHAGQLITGMNWILNNVVWKWYERNKEEWGNNSISLLFIYTIIYSFSLT